MENNIRKDLASPRPFRQEQRAERQTDLSACPSARGADRPVICLPAPCKSPSLPEQPKPWEPAESPHGAGASSAPLRFPARHLGTEEPNPWRDGTQGRQGWQSHWFPLEGFGLVFGLGWKPTTVRSRAGDAGGVTSPSRGTHAHPVEHWGSGTSSSCRRGRTKHRS